MMSFRGLLETSVNLFLGNTVLAMRGAASIVSFRMCVIIHAALVHGTHENSLCFKEAILHAIMEQEENRSTASVSLVSNVATLLL